MRRLFNFMIRLPEYIAILTFLVIANNLKASSSYIFRAFDVSNGLPENTVKCITQDEKGFLWLGTFNGLCRFDGVNFQTFVHNADERASVVSNMVYALYPQKGGVWVGTDKGLDFFSFRDHRFCHATLHTDTGEVVQWSRNVKNILSAGGKVVVHDNAGKLYIHRSELQFEACKYELADFYSVCSYKENLILAHAYNGIYVIDITNGKTMARYPLKKTMPSETICFSEKQRKVYIGYGIDRPTEVYEIDAENHLKKIENAQAPAGVDRVIEWGDNMLFGTNGKGLIEDSGCDLTSYTTMNSTISSDVITCLFVDCDKNLWVGTYRDGLNLCSKSFTWFKSLNVKNGKLKHKLVTAVTSRGDELFIGLDGGGLCAYDLSADKSVTYTTQNSSIINNHILSVADDGEYIWLAAYYGGLCRFSPETRTFRNYPLSSGYVWSIKDDGRGHIWVVGRDVHIFDKDTGNYALVEGLNNVWASDVVFDRGKVWISTSGAGIFLLDEETKKILAHYHEDSEEHPLPDRDVPYLYIASNHDVWFTVHNLGLFRLDKNNRMVVYGKESGLTASNVMAMLEDTGGYIWIGTEKGVFRFNPRTETFICFSKKDYLPSVQINHNACFKEGDRMYFGTTDGLVYFAPDEVDYGDSLKSIFFRDITLLKNDSIIYVDAKEPAEVIKLAYDQNFFTIGFSLPELVFADKMRFSCRMEGFEESWRDIGNDRQVTYTNLPPGEYTFVIRTLDWDGQWSREAASLHIRIAPPWWRTYWAMGLWIFLAGGVLYSVYCFYRYQNRIKRMVREEEMEKNMVKKDNEMKLRFFTNISHEFRTPLSLIISPLEILIKNETDGVRRDKLSRIHKNARSLLNLVNQLLDFRKLEMQGEKLNASFGDLVEFIDAISLIFQEKADSEQKELSFLPKVGSLYMTFDKDKIRKVLNNLLSNAFKFTDAGAQIIIIVDRLQEEGQEYAVIEVKDTGLGIRPDKLPHVFERFYQEEGAQGINTGSGIGLHIVKEYVMLHQGQVKAESIVGKGTSFIVRLPVVSRQASAAITEVLPEKVDMENISAVDAGRKKLLVVEDNGEFRCFLTEQLEADYCVVQAADGEEGERVALEELPDIIISDVMMPRVDGVELCRRIKNNIRISHIPVILLTARASNDSMLSGYEAGADEYISKPFDFDVLLMKICKLIRQQEERKAEFEHSIEIKPVDITITSLDEKLLQDSLQAIENNLSNTEYSIDDLSNDVGLSRTNLYKKLQSITGKTPANFMRAVRLKKAARLLRDSQLNISEISDCVGFGNVKYFNKHFKEEFGMTPSLYRVNYVQN